MLRPASQHVEPPDYSAAGCPHGSWRSAVVAGALGWCAPAQAQQAELEREWQSSTLFSNRDDLWLRTSWARGRAGRRGRALEPGRGRRTTTADRSRLRSALAARASVRPRCCDTGSSERHVVVGSAAGGALAVWFDVRRAGAVRGRSPRDAAPSQRRRRCAEDAGGYPAAAMNERRRRRGALSHAGRSLAPHGVRRASRSAPAELIATDDDGWPATLSVAADGGVVIGYQARDQVVVRIARAGARPGALGTRSARRPMPARASRLRRRHGCRWKRRGSVRSDDTTRWATLRIAFKPRDAAGFGAPRNTGVATMAIDQRDLVVTAPAGADRRSHDVRATGRGREPDRVGRLLRRRAARADRTRHPAREMATGKPASARTSAVTRSSPTTS